MLPCTCSYTRMCVTLRCVCVCVHLHGVLINSFLSTAKIQLVYTPSGGSAQQVSNPHYVSDGSIGFTMDCRGSGNLWWTSPTGGNVSLVPSDNPNQQTSGPLRRTLSFQSWSEELNGLYTCSSDLDGTSRSLTIANSKSNDP